MRDREQSASRTDRMVSTAPVEDDNPIGDAEAHSIRFSERG